MNRIRRAKGSLTKLEIEYIIEQDLKGFSQDSTSKKINVPPATVNRIINYYRGRDTAGIKNLYIGYKKIIDSIKNPKDIEINKEKEFPSYKIKILFGLITLTANPIEVNDRI